MTISTIPANDQGSSPGVIMPPVGSHWRVPPKIMSRMRPSQKVGTDQKTREVEDMILSKTELRRQAGELSEPQPQADREDGRGGSEQECGTQVLDDE